MGIDSGVFWNEKSIENTFEALSFKTAETSPILLLY
jgi:hypothetical protein